MSEAFASAWSLMKAPIYEPDFDLELLALRYGTCRPMRKKGNNNSTIFSQIT